MKINKLKKICLAFAINLAIIALFLQSAGAENLWEMQEGMKAESGQIGESFSTIGANKDVRDLTVTIIKYLLTFLGLIAVIIMMAAGFRWMNSRGNEEEVKKAQGQIKAAVIGLIIIISAFVLTSFVIKFADQALRGDFKQ